MSRVSVNASKYSKYMVGCYIWHTEMLYQHNRSEKSTENNQAESNELGNVRSQ